MKSYLIIASLSFCFLAADWPRFRGPNGSGTAKEPIRFDFAGDQAASWSVEIQGDGNGSPVIQGAWVYYQSAAGNDRRLTCLNCFIGKSDQPGKKGWSRGQTGHSAKAHRKNTLASATPAIDGKRIVEIIWDGGQLVLAAYSLHGDELWVRKIGSFQSEHGAGISPILDDDRVFVNFDQDGKAQAMAFNAADGEPLWSAQRKAYRASYSTPFIRHSTDHKEVVFTSTAGVTAYDPATGNIIWDYEWGWSSAGAALRTVGSSIEADGLIVAAGGEGGGSSRVIAIKPPDGSAGKPALVWEKKKGFPYVPTVLASGKYLFTVNDRGIAGCYIAKTGQELWLERLGGAFSASPVLAGDKIYAVNEDGVIYVCKAAPKYELLARRPLGEPVIATPAVANGNIYIRGKQHLFCFGPPTPPDR